MMNERYRMNMLALLLPMIFAVPSIGLFRYTVLETVDISSGIDVMNPSRTKPTKPFPMRFAAASWSAYFESDIQKRTTTSAVTENLSQTTIHSLFFYLDPFPADRRNQKRCQESEAIEQCP